MGILDSLLGSMLGGQQATSPMQSILGSILGGGGGGGGGQQGGLGGLVQQFTNAGLANHINSWIGNGPNQPVDPSQLQHVFGQQQIGQWAQQAGMAPQDLLGQLAHFLPHAVDQMTPNGQLPTSGGSPFDDAGTELGGPTMTA